MSGILIFTDPRNHIILIVVDRLLVTIDDYEQLFKFNHIVNIAEKAQ